ncbi:hypothetical protein AA0488_2923 [Kozakia baliensis NRIC 0488]|uniref:Uncharacterized protein n=1 Tax=Kozakia baliensis TaxID=153496 RepID=A0A1D8UY60_9PROT|nr:hypothetical protein A0U89_14790 [Kozakia baliensis]AOX21520.1 hypothetical protein A0U90_13530 [Kozakia baliensis]GBR35111.1 hypothetical protein AA0488_2923 [Kozakia baliensis NRIC 0488]
MAGVEQLFAGATARIGSRAPDGGGMMRRKRGVGGTVIEKSRFFGEAAGQGARLLACDGPGMDQGTGHGIFLSAKMM